jgi:hypothetical protein
LWFKKYDFSPPSQHKAKSDRKFPLGATLQTADKKSSI